MITPADRGDGGMSGRFEQHELFEYQFTASYPKKDTKAGIALADLLTGAVITQPDWLSRGVGWRLAAAVKELGYLGWPVRSMRISWPGSSRPIAAYKLPQPVLRQIGGLTHE